MNNNVYLSKAIETSILAGQAILEVYHSDFSVEYKTDSSPLTLADRRSHEVIVKHLSEFDIPILSEEGKNIPYAERKSWDRLWIVDPLDGTKEFVKRNGEFTVNIALVENHKPVLGVIFVPDKKALFFAADGAGAYKLEKNWGPEPFESHPDQEMPEDRLNELIEMAERLPANQPSLSLYTIVGSRSHQTPELKAYVEEKRQELGEIEFIAAGSSQKFCVVAEGRANVYPRLGPTMEWDTAAGQAIAENAGATVVRHDNGEPLTYNKEDLYNPYFIVQRS
ncbi:MAG: 3'(2'),5'-bisphosphate nucleotidase CysQ [Deltaproteobacteria bacterium]|jgi:3'(2'), 5'-bisphosphate nucleotidase|nr:3'(2'),5'-bisphosphate nucleotidase CysQ [Deltaproteobacteria bacterium]